MRQAFYARQLPARIWHLVKAPVDASSEPFGDGAVSVEPLPVRRWGQYVWAAARTGARLLRRQRIDLVQVQEPFVCGLAGAYLARRFAIPLVAGAYSDQVDNPVWTRSRLIHRMANAVGKSVYRRAHAIRADSRSVEMRLRKGGFHQTRFIPFLITNADTLGMTHPAAESLRAELLAKRMGPLLLAVVRLEPEKNVPLMLRAVSAVRVAHPEAILAIAGDGSLRGELERLGQQLLPDAVRWLGWVPNHEMAACYQAADLLLLSSDFESSARVLTESLLAGTPVLTTDTAGASEVVEDGVTGKIVPVGDLESFAKALDRLVGRGADLAEMGRRGQGAMLRTVRAEVVIEQLRAMYRSALGSA